MSAFYRWEKPQTDPPRDPLARRVARAGPAAKLDLEDLARGPAPAPADLGDRPVCTRARPHQDQRRRLLALEARDTGPAMPSIRFVVAKSWAETRMRRVQRRAA